MVEISSVAPNTRERILEAAGAAFGSAGVDATSLDDLAARLGVRKQTILYWFASKEVLVSAVVEAAAVSLATELQAAVAGGPGGWPTVQRLLRAMFRLGARRPEVLGLVREVNRIGGSAPAALAAPLAPLVASATRWLDAEMDAGRLTRHDPGAVVLAAYSMLTGLAVELETQRALGLPTDLRSVVRRERAVERLLQSALQPLANVR